MRVYGPRIHLGLKAHKKRTRPRSTRIYEDKRPGAIEFDFAVPRGSFVHGFSLSKGRFTRYDFVASDKSHPVNWPKQSHKPAPED